MRSFTTEGIIIKRRNFGEADRILTVFTKRNGKIKVKASGVRKINSRRSSHVELLNHSMLTLYMGRAMPILTEAQTVEDFSEVKEDLGKVGFAYHICELLDGLCPENQENNNIFSLLKNSLTHLTTNEGKTFINEFERELLSILGFYSKTQFNPNFNTQNFIENILERRLKSKQFISRLS